jgi:hypothetical protein
MIHEERTMCLWDRSARAPGLFVVGLFLAGGLVLGAADDAWAQRGGDRCLGGSGGSGGSGGGMMGNNRNSRFAGDTASPGMSVNSPGCTAADGEFSSTASGMARVRRAVWPQEVMVAYGRQQRAQRLVAAYRQQQQREARLNSVRNRRDGELAQRAVRRQRTAEMYARYKASKTPQFAATGEMAGQRR